MPALPPERDARTTAAFPGPAAIGDAFRFVFGRKPPQAPLGAWAVYLPLAGAVLGALWMAIDASASRLTGRVLASAAVLLVHAAATRARPLLALGKTLAALPAVRERRLAMITAPSGPAAIAAACVVALIEIALLATLDRLRLVGLAFAPLFGCCTMVVLAVGSRAARADGRRVKFAPAVTFREFALASVATFALVFLSTEFLGLLLILATAAFAIAARVFLHRWLDGVDETVLRAVGEATQVVVLAVLAVL